MGLSPSVCTREARWMDSQPPSPGGGNGGEHVAAYFRDPGLQLECLLWEAWEEELTLGTPTFPTAAQGPLLLQEWLPSWSPGAVPSTR